MNYIQYMQIPFQPIMQQDVTRAQQTHPMQTIVHPLSQTEGYLTWSAKQSNPNVEAYEKFLQDTQKNKSTISQGREMTEKEKLASQQKLELYGQLEKEARNRQKAGEVVLEGLNYISPSYWANQAGANLNGAESFLFDIAADPTTYLSLGVIPLNKAIVKKAAKEGIEKGMKETAEILAANRMRQSLKHRNGYIGGVSKHQIQSGVQDAISDLTGLYTSDHYWQSLKSAGFSDDEALKVIDQYATRAQNSLKNSNITNETLNPELQGLAGSYNPATKEVMLNSDRISNQLEARVTGVHEGGHASTTGIDLRGKSGDINNGGGMGHLDAERLDGAQPGDYAHIGKAQKYNQSLVDVEDPTNWSQSLLSTQDFSDPRLQELIVTDANGKVVLSDEAIARARTARAIANSEGIPNDLAYKLDISDIDDLELLLNPQALKKFTSNVLSFGIPITLGGVLYSSHSNSAGAHKQGGCINYLTYST